MDRGSGRYSYNRRQGGGQSGGHSNQHHNNHSNSSLSSSSSSSLSSSSNNHNNNHYDNHNSYSHRNASSNNSSHYSNNPQQNSSSSGGSLYINSTHISNNTPNVSREPITQHDELIRYIREAWTKSRIYICMGTLERIRIRYIRNFLVKMLYISGVVIRMPYIFEVSEQSTSIIYNEADNQLNNFKPFNLEEYWGQRLVQNIHVSHGHQ